MTIEQAFALAMRHQGAGDLGQAETVYRQILVQQPRHAGALCQLGLIAAQTGRRESAVDWFRQAIAANPGAAETHNHLGIALGGCGRFAEAMAAFREALALKPDFPEALCNLAVALRARGQIEAAIAACRRALAIRANYPAALYNLGNALRDHGESAEAISAYRRAISLAPRLLEAHGNLGIALLERRRFEEAIAAFRQAIALDPSVAEVHLNLGNALREQSRFDEAIAAYRQAVALRPELADAHGNLGLAMQNLGRFEEAAASFRRALAIKPEARFYKGLALTGRGVAGAGEMERLTALLEQVGLAEEDRATAEFTLGKLLDEAERYDEAFGHFVRGNQLFKELRARSGERFDARELRRMTDGLIRDFAPPFFTQRAGWGNSSELPVFIVGMPRTGTSLVEQIAASHPAVFGAGELLHIEHVAAALRVGAGSAAQWEAQAIADAAHAYLASIQSPAPGALRVTDKMPGNVFHLGLIALMFPGARVIFCRRDARDNCLSCYCEQFVKSRMLYTYDLADCGRQYVETRRLIDHWRRVLPLRMLEVRYESLVAEPETESRRLIDFLGLDWNPACLEFHRTQRPVLTASVWQVRQPMYQRSAGRWRHYQRHLGPLLEVLEQGGEKVVPNAGDDD